MTKQGQKRTHRESTPIRKDVIDCEIHQAVGGAFMMTKADPRKVDHDCWNTQIVGLMNSGRSLPASSVDIERQSATQRSQHVGSAQTSE